MERESIQLDGISLEVVLTQDEDGIWVAEIPSLPGCISQGYSYLEALENIKEAAQGLREENFITGKVNSNHSSPPRKPGSEKSQTPSSKSDGE